MLRTEAPFCEFYKQGNTLPEIVNSLTSLAYIGSAIMSLVCSDVARSSMGKFAISVLFVLGASSFAFHYTLWKVMGNLDVLSTLCVSYFGAFLCIESVRRFLFVMGIDATVGMAVVFHLSYFVALAVWFSPNNGLQFYQFVIPPQLFVLLSVVCMNIIWKWSTYLSDDAKKAIKYVNIGALVLCVSALAPILLDRSCESSLLNAHALWHIGSAYGIHLLVQSFLCIGANSMDRSGYKFRTDHFVFYILPCIKHHP